MASIFLKAVSKNLSLFAMRFLESLICDFGINICLFKGKFFIGVMQPNGKNERILADGYLVESPTWAPNGRVLIFFRQMEPTANGVTRSVKLFSIDLTGYNEREIVTPLDASDPAWSPLNP